MASSKIPLLSLNEVSMGEENIKAKKKKLDHEERSLDEQLAEERKEREKREQKLAEQDSVGPNYSNYSTIRIVRTE